MRRIDSVLTGTDGLSGKGPTPTGHIPFCHPSSTKCWTRAGLTRSRSTSPHFWW